MKEISLENLKLLEFESFKNSIRLHFDAFNLFRNKSFPSAYFLDILALEELGKTFTLNSIRDHRWIYHDLDDEWYKKYIASLYNHKNKQSAFMTEMHLPFDITRKLANFYKRLEKNKENAVYVGVNKGNNHLIIPYKLVNHKKARGQLFYLNNKLLHWCTIEKEGIGYCGNEKIHRKLISKNFFSEAQ